MSEDKTATQMKFGGRTYIQRLRNDPRTRAMFQGWVAQATAEAEQRYPDRHDDRQRAYYAAERALELGMSFVLDNDGELAATREQLEKVLESSLELANARPPHFFVPAKYGE